MTGPRRWIVAALLVGTAILVLSLNHDDPVGSRAPRRADIAPRVAPDALPTSAREEWSGVDTPPEPDRAEMRERLREYDRTLAIHPADPYTYLRRGRLLMQMGRLEEALASLREGIRLDPTDPTTHQLMANVLRRLGRTVEALAVERHVVKLPDGPGTLRGVVVEPDGAPVSYATLRLWDRSVLVTEVPIHGGRYEIGLDFFPSRVQAVAPGFAPSMFQRVRTAGSGSVWELPVLRLRPSCRLTGSVLFRDRTPVKGEVKAAHLDGSCSITAQSGADGSFVIENLAQGTYTVSLPQPPGQAAVRVVVSVKRDAEVLLTVVHLVTVAGTVRDALGRALEGVSVAATRRANWSRWKARTDAEGRFALSLQPGTVALQVLSPDRKASALVQIMVGSAPRNVEITLRAKPRLTGRVLRAGRPLGGVRLTLTSTDGDSFHTASSGKTGEYAFEVSFPGGHRLRVALPGRQTSILTELTLRSGEVLRHDIVIPAGTVAGSVVDAGGRPVDGAWIFLKRGANIYTQAAVEEDGTFRVEGLPQERLEFFVRQPTRGLLARGQVDLRGGEPIEDLRITVYPGAMLRGRLLGPQGLPVAGFEVKIRALEFPLNRQATTDAEGRFELGPLYDARYGLTADKSVLEALASQWKLSGLRLDAAEFEVLKGHASEIEAHLVAD